MLKLSKGGNWQKTARNYSKMREARAAHLFSPGRPIKFLIGSLIGSNHADEGNKNVTNLHI